MELDWQESTPDCWHAETLHNTYELIRELHKWRLEASVGDKEYRFNGTRAKMEKMAEELEIQSYS